MLKLIKNANVFTPEPLGNKDVLITAEKTGYIQDGIDIGKEIDIEVIDGEGALQREGAGCPLFGETQKEPIR